MHSAFTPSHLAASVKKFGHQGCSWNACQRSPGWLERLGLKSERVLGNGLWYCSAECLEEALRHELRSPMATALAPVVPRHRLPIGLLLLSRGVITSEMLQKALAAQSSTREPRKIGECLRELGYVKEEEITAALGSQWSCPIFSHLREADLECANMVPLILQERYAMLPVRYVARTQVLYIAFCRAVHYSLLYAVERLLDLTTRPCLITPEEWQWGLLRSEERPRKDEVSFVTTTSASEAARIVRNYVCSSAATEVRARVCGEYLWAHLRAPSKRMNLLFRAASLAAPSGDNPAVVA